VSHRRAPENQLDGMRRLYRVEYSDFRVKHFHDELRHTHDYTLRYTLTRLALQSSGQVRPAESRGNHRKSVSDGRCLG
jgi:hypothetical protein